MGRLNYFLREFPTSKWVGLENRNSFKGAVSRFYHEFERFKNTPRSYIAQQKWFYFGNHHSANDNNPLGSEYG